jgi:SAM-dependent methyltransferase
MDDRRRREKSSGAGKLGNDVSAQPSTTWSEPRQHLGALQPTSCAICGTAGNADELFRATLTPSAFTATIFSARRLPDRVHYRVVRCRSCDLVRSDPVLGADGLAKLYRASTFEYGDELDGLCATYGRALAQLAELVPERAGLLDIGTGSGFVLELARDRGWTGVRGVEPSEDAVAKARSDIRPLISADVMRPGLFEPGSFDAVTMFQVLDHMPDPVGLLNECRRVLRPGGVVLAFNHNVTAWSARLLGERSPIIDVEHTYLYSPRTIRTLFDRAGFEVVSVRPVRNTYTVRYLAQLLPLPDRQKSRLLSLLRGSKVGRLEATVPLGNLCMMARGRS